MPIVLKPNELHIKDGDEFTGMNVVAEQTTDEMIAEIESKGGETVSAIETKGAQTIASIPSDYTALSNEVTDLKADLSETNERLDDTETLGVVITSGILEVGRIDDSGTPVSHSSRCRTKEYIPVSKGDKIYLEYDNNTGKGVDLYFYDTSKSFLSKTGWKYFTNYNGSFVDVTADGYFKCVFTSNTFSDFDKHVSLARCSQKKNAIFSLEARTNMNILPVDTSNLEYGYWVNSNGSTWTMYRAKHRVKTITPIVVKQGDKVCFTKKNSVYADICFKKVLDTSPGTFSPAYTNFPFIAPYDGYIFINFKKSDGSDIDDITVFSGLITVEKFSEFGSVETIKTKNLYNGYITDSTYIISDHPARLVNWMPIHANKGDIVRVNSLDLMFRPYEFNRSGVCVAFSANYITTEYVGGNFNLCGDYIVQNDDCWIMCVLAPAYGSNPSSFLP